MLPYLSPVANLAGGALTDWCFDELLPESIHLEVELEIVFKS